MKYDDTQINPVQAQILAVLGPAPNDTYVDLPGGFRAIKVSRQHEAATYVGEVRIAGPMLDGCSIAVASSMLPSGLQSLPWMLPHPNALPRDPCGLRTRTVPGT